MTDATNEESTEPPKSGKLPLIIGAVLALIGGGGGFYAASSGMIFATESKEEVVEEEKKSSSEFSDISFLPLEPMTISMPRGSAYKHLRFRGELEVPKEYAEDVKKVTPRVIDVLNGYLRALQVSDIEEPASLTRLRSQMLRRIQIVAGPGRVNDLLIMEFVLN
ncbi:MULTISPECIES: flagellar basal body-associated FliL family protein [Roseobacter]|uniref:Flagellar protein FliL n=1 Tax=Roseobacter litoralis (strain ATCC 49566 / DSM 6996 / JCM 21268 / NBRC 15278 / OCh 149) TaxID=391595 RepID=F7ZDW2_ROSLO|nr:MULTISPECIES: flagellar basal body-associated FliL family protein [Roseobacter]AEI92081.1 flagellar basal body-associated protein FliL [Roseobacter litoralis Och 149]GIT87381.1 flagellar basal body protein FliL [Roseobacter sp. OBYS 0001]